MAYNVKLEDFFYDPGKVPTEADIMKFIEKKKVQNTYFSRLEDYYLGNHDILLKPAVDATMPCNRVVNNYCAMIVDFFNSFLMGKPIQYKSANEELLKEIKSILDYNDSHDIDVITNQNSNIMGASAEQIYTDEDGKLRICNVDYKSVIFVYNKNVQRNLNCVIKFFKYLDTDAEYVVELWTPTQKTVYKMTEAMSQLRIIEPPVGHPFIDVPFVEYWNNEYKTSSFYDIISLQNAYNTLCSSEIDDYEGFVDSFLAIYNAAGTDEDDIAAMKKNRVLLLDGESRAEWLVKNMNPAQIEQIKATIEKNIHKVSNLPDLSDQNFSSNASGVAIKYKTIGAEAVAARQERKFKKGLQRRIELMVGFLNLKGSTKYNYLDVEIVFNRNMIGADLEIAQLINLVGESVPVAPIAQNLSFMSKNDVEWVKKMDDKKLAADSNPRPASAKDPEKVVEQQR